MEVSRIILNIVSFKTFLSDQLHPVMMASISFICFLFLLGLTGAHPVADESRSYLFSFFTRNKKFRLGKYLLTFEGFFQLEGMKSRNLVNGKENEPRMQYDSIKAIPPVNGIDDEPVRDLMNAPRPSPRPSPRPLKGKSRSFSLHNSCFCVYVSRCSWLLQHIYSPKSGR